LSGTISTWICKTISLAYVSSGQVIPDKFQVKAHNVRALASSWALFNNASLNEVLSAGFWRGGSSFLSHYLRSMSVQADNLFSLGPIVSAQRVNFPPVSSDSGTFLASNLTRSGMKGRTGRTYNL
jgi:hypothetical protein